MSFSQIHHVVQSCKRTSSINSKTAAEEIQRQIQEHFKAAAAAQAAAAQAAAAVAAASTTVAKTAASNGPLKSAFSIRSLLNYSNTSIRSGH